MNARPLAIATLIALLLHAPSARAQCSDWKAGPLDAGSAANGANGDIQASIIWDPDGPSGPQQPRLVVGGLFTSFDGVPANHLAEQDPATGQWHELGGGVGFGVYAMTIWNNELVVAGSGDTNPATPDNNILAWDGTSWTNNFYQGTSTGTIQTLVNFNGELYAGGNFVIYPTVLDVATNIAHWNVSAGKWENVAGPGTSPGQNVEALTVWGGVMYAGTYYHDGSGNPHGDVWSFDGANWTSMVTCDNFVDAFQPYDGELVIGGGFQVVGTSSIRVLMAYNGSYFHAYGSWTYGGVYSLGVWGNDLAVGGQFTNGAGQPTNNIVLYDYLTGLWTAPGTGCDNFVMTLLSDGGDLFAGGWFANAGGQPAHYGARWSGYEWAPMGGGNVAGVQAMTYYAGRLVLGGAFNQSADPGTPAHEIVGWNGANLAAYGSGMDDQVNALKAYTIGVGLSQTYELVAGGYFTHAGGVAANRIAYWDQRAVSYTPPAWTAMGAGFDNAVLAIERHNAGSGNNTYAAGSFQWSGATYLGYVGRWNGTSLAWESMGGGMNGVVYALKSYGGALYAGGSFTTAGGVSTGGLARWNGTGWSACGGFFNGTVYSLEVWNGVLVIGGSYPGINSSPNLAWYNGTSYGTFSTGGADAAVFALHAVGTNLYVGGQFNTCGGVSAHHVAQWDGSAWHPLTNGTDNTVYSLGDFGGEILAGGAFTTAGSTPTLSPHAARYTSTGLAWFTSQPYSQTVNRGSTVTFGAAPASGYGATERWYLNGAALVDGATFSGSTISGSTGATLTIANVSGFDTGNYYAVLTDGCGPDTSYTAALSLSSTTGVDGRGPLVTAFDAIGPNPSRGASLLSFTLARDARVEVRVLDIAGRRVGGADLGRLGAGRHEAMWSARDAGGDAARPGLYFVSLAIDGRTIGTRRMTIVR